MVLNLNKIGRNQPCPCGSGKKYKKCCLLEENKIKSAEVSLRNKIVEFANQSRFDEDYEIAFDLFFDESSFEVDLEREDEIRFRDWYIHDYRLREYQKSIIELFYEEKSFDLSIIEKEILEEWQDTLFGVYEVINIEEGKGVYLKDIFQKNEYFAHDVRCSKSLSKWDIVVMRIITIKGKYYLSGGGLVFNQSKKRELLDFGIEQFRRYREEHTDASWKDFMKDRGYVFNHLYAPSMQKRDMENFHAVTPEGDEVIFSEAVYHVKDFNKVIERMKDIEDLVKVGTLETGGEIEEAYYTWIIKETTHHSTFKNLKMPNKILVVFRSRYFESPDGDPYLSLGDIVINKDQLLLECVSKERLKDGKRLLENILKDAIEHQFDSFQDFGSSGSKERQEIDDEIPPDIKDQLLKSFLEDHYNKWIDSPIPALNGKTPREMSKTKEGRAKLEDLLKIAENLEERKKKRDEVSYDIDKIRKKLNLPLDTREPRF